MPSVRVLLGALLHHPDCAVVQHTAKVLAAAAEAFPLEGFEFLPLVLFKVRVCLSTYNAIEENVAWLQIFSQLTLRKCTG